MKTNKAIGLDKISAKLLKDASEVIAPSIQKLINMSITQCCFPDLWKSAKITAIFKSGNPQDCDNYRPISILPTLSKILERAVKSQLYNYLEENSLLYSQQSGFRSRRSTSTALLQMTDTLLNNMDKRQVTGVVYLDLKKAFDTVNRSLLLRKLGAYGVDDRCVKWFRSYLTHRTQCTTIGEVSSTKRSVPVGVPQGTVLGPLLFLIYINDITECLKNTQASLFADDTMVYCSGSTRNELQENLNGDLSRIKKWLNDHRLTINAEKSQFMVIGSSQRIKAFESMILRIDEDELEKVTSYKYLGVIINETVNWSEHIEMIQRKVLQRLGMLRRIKHLLPQSTREVVVNTLILPLLDYGDLVWGDKSNDTLMNSLQVLQNKAAKEVLNMRSYDSSTLALQSLYWRPLKFRRQFHRSQFVYKSIENNTVDFQFDNRSGSEVHLYNTRMKDQLRLPATNTNWGQLRTNYHFIKEWNTLPKTVTNANTKANFKSAFWNMHV